MLKTLQSIGFKLIDAKVYFFLTNMGPQKARSIAEALHLHKNQLYRSLKTLQNRGIVCASQEFPACFSAVNLEVVVDSLVNEKKEQALKLQESKEELLLSWRALTKKGNNCI